MKKRRQSLAKNVSQFLSRVLYIPALLFITTCIPNNNSLYLTPKEIQYIQSLQKPVIALPCPDYPPIDFTDNSGNLVGLSHDYLSEIGKITGISFKKISVSTWADVLQAAKDRKVDIVLSIQDVPERHSYLRFTKPYVRIPNVIVTRKSFTKNLTLKDLKDLHVAAVKGYAVVDYITRQYPKITIDLVKNEIEGLMKLSFDEYDAMIISLSTVSYLIDRYSITNLRIAGNVGYDWNLCFGVRNDDPMLYSIISKALNSIADNKRNAIYRKWISLAPRPVYFESEFWYIIAIIIIGGLLVIIGIVAWNSSL